jgi:hypothetical protein
MSTEKKDEPAATSTPLDDKLTKDAEDLENTVDETPGSFINEALWRKVFWKALSYLVQIIALCTVTDGAITFNLVKFVWGCSFMLLPIIYSGLDVQSRNKENQERLKADKELKLQESAADARLKDSNDKLQAAEKELKEKEIELFKVKLELDLKTQNIAANQAAIAAVTATPTK